MPKYSIAFIAPNEHQELKHRIMDGESKEEVLKEFFKNEAAEFYSSDDQGFFYFKDDFFDQQAPAGSLLEI